MEQKFLISVTLTLCAFALTLILLVVVVSVQNGMATAEVTASGMAGSPSKPQEGIKHPGEKVFNANCKACHRIHQKLVGPALAGVLERRDSIWVIKMIKNSSQLIASGDPTAVKLFREYNGTQMTSFNSISDEDLRVLLEYIKLESERELEVVPSSLRVEV